MAATVRLAGIQESVAVAVTGTASGTGVAGRVGLTTVRLARITASTDPSVTIATVRVAEVFAGAVQSRVAWNGVAWVADSVLFTAQGAGRGAGVASGSLGGYTGVAHGTGQGTGQSDGLLVKGGSASGTGEGDAVVTGVGTSDDPDAGVAFVHAFSFARGAVMGTPDFRAVVQGGAPITRGVVIGAMARTELIAGSGAGRGFARTSKFTVRSVFSGNGVGTGLAKGKLTASSQFTGTLTLSAVGSPTVHGQAAFIVTATFKVPQETATFTGSPRMSGVVTLRATPVKVKVRTTGGFTATVAWTLSQVQARQPLAYVRFAASIVLAAEGSTAIMSPIGVTIPPVHYEGEILDVVAPGETVPMKIWDVIS